MCHRTIGHTLTVSGVGSVGGHLVPKKQFDHVLTVVTLLRCCFPPPAADMSLWDIHRTQLPWLSLTQPTRFRDILSSLQHMAQQGSGDIPKWPLLNTYTGCMIGSHAWVTFAEAKNAGNAALCRRLAEAM